MKIDEQLVLADQDEEEGDWELAIWKRLVACGDDPKANPITYHTTTGPYDAYVYVWRHNHPTPSMTVQSTRRKDTDPVWYAWEPCEGWKECSISRSTRTRICPVWVYLVLQEASREAVLKIMGELRRRRHNRTVAPGMKEASE